MISKELISIAHRIHGNNCKMWENQFQEHISMMRLNPFFLYPYRVIGWISMFEKTKYLKSISNSPNLY